MGGKNWTTEEIKYIKQNANNKTDEDMANDLKNRTISSVTYKRTSLGIPKFNPENNIWSNVEDDFILKNYEKMTTLELSKSDELKKRNEKSVMYRKKSLGVSTNVGKLWTQDELDYLKEVWEDMSVHINDIENRLNRRMKNISNKARSIGLYRGVKFIFSKDELLLLKEHYPNMSARDLKEKYFPDKTEEQIINAGYNHKIKKTDNYMKTQQAKIGLDNLKKLNFNKDICSGYKVDRIELACDFCGDTLLRTESDLKPSNFCSNYCRYEYYRGRNKGDSNPNWRGGISNLTSYMRNSINEWKKESIKNSDDECVITKSKEYDIHHLESFHTIVQRCLDILCLDVRESICEYSEDELNDIRLCTVEEQRKSIIGICIHNDIHKKFHSEYGYFNNTPGQFYEFAFKYYNMDVEKKLNLKEGNINGKN